MNLVTNHVLEPLIEGGSKENHDFQSFACETIVHDLVSILLVAEFMKQLRNVIHALAAEGSGVTLRAIETCHLGEQTLDQVADGHARGDSVRVHDHIRHDALSRERKILLSVSHSARSLLTVPTSKLISDLRNSNCSHFDLSEPEIVLIVGNNNLIDDSTLSVFQWSRAIFVLFSL
jgi:hypothetical protein